MIEAIQSKSFREEYGVFIAEWKKISFFLKVLKMNKKKLNRNEERTNFVSLNIVIKKNSW